MMEVKATYVMANKLVEWKDLKIAGVGLEIDDESIGFIQVFRTVEDLKRKLGDNQPYTEINCAIEIEKRPRRQA